MQPRRVTKAFLESVLSGEQLIEALGHVGIDVPEDVRTIRISSGRGFVQFSESDDLVVSWEDRT